MATLSRDRVSETLRLIELALVAGSPYRAHSAVDRCFAVDVVCDDDPIAVLPLSSRIVGHLERSGIHSIGQLRSITDTDLFLLPNISTHTVRDIRDALATIDAETRQHIGTVADFDRGFFADVDGA